MADDEVPWYRSLLVGVAALLGVALLVGGLVGVVALGAVKVVGLGDSQPTAEAQPSLYIPERTPGEEEDEDEQGVTLEDLNPDAAAESQEPTSAPSASREPRPKPRRPRSVISLSASPVEVSPMEEIYLSGTYPRAEGATLQVQRFEGTWQEFPTSATVSGGTFTTYVKTGRTGQNRFRVVDQESGKTSNPVSVRVR